MEGLGPRVLAASERLAGKRDLRERTRRLAAEGNLAALDPERLGLRVDRLLRTPLAAKVLSEKGVADELKGLSTVENLSERAKGELERLIEGADFYPAWFLSRGAEVRATVARVKARAPGGTESMGTGFLAGPRLLLTNFHVLDWTDEGGPDLGQIAPGSLFEFDYEERFDGTLRPVSTYAADPATLLLASPWQKLDYVLVALQPVSREGDRSLLDYGYDRLAADLGKIVKGEPVYVIQHPRGQPKQVVVRNNLLVDRDEGSATPYLTYEADTDLGSSGSPVFNRQWEVVALHHATEIVRDGAGRILARDGSPWNPSSGPENVKYGDLNEGVRVSSIVRDLGAKLQALRDGGSSALGPGERGSEAGLRLLEEALAAGSGASPTALAQPVPVAAVTSPRRQARRGGIPEPD